MIILAIETSCDDTGVAVLKAKNGSFEVLSNIISSQVEIHAEYGGVVPSLAARAHLSNIETCLKKALKEAFGNSVSKGFPVDFIAVTKGPGLIPALLVGVNFAKALSYNWNKPIIGINHIEAHLYANWLPLKNSQRKKNSKDTSERRGLASRHGLLRSKRSEQAPAAKILAGDFREAKKSSFEVFPALCLLVSGGHTQLVLMKDHGDYKILGETRDDAAGEAFDKVAQLLDLGYPGGPAISQQAEKWKSENPTFFLPFERGGSRRGLKVPDIEFARPMINSKNYDFSFSGIKTSVLYKIRKLEKLTPEIKAKISFEFQQAVIDVLVHKTIKAAKENQVKTIMLSGGVAANKELRKQMKKKIQKETPQAKYRVPELKHCTDNAAMIATTAYFRQKEATTWDQIEAESNLSL